MSHATRLPLRRIVSPAMTRPGLEEDVLTMRMLRHHTKNALQRIIAQVTSTELRATPAGNVLADEVERRIRLSACISDALFGFTAVPSPLATRLVTLSRSVVSLMSDQVQTIGTTVDVSGTCPPTIEATIVQAAHEMVTNAVKHGLHMRLTGEIEVTVEGRRPGSPSAGVTLVVRDDGWGPDKPGFNEGMTVLELMAERHGGTVDLVRERGWTVSRLAIPAFA